MKYLKKYKLFEQVDFIGEFRSHVDDPIIAEIYGTTREIDPISLQLTFSK